MGLCHSPDFMAPVITRCNACCQPHHGLYDIVEENRAGISFALTCKMSRDKKINS